MATFTIVEKQELKMVQAVIQDETITAEAGALHYMQGKVELSTPAPSAKGFFKAIATQESIFRPTYTGTGTVYFGPPSFGEYMVLDIDNESWILDKGAFVCASAGVDVGVFRNKAMSALFSGEGFFQTKVEGTGQVVIYADGEIQAVDLENDTLVVDGHFAVARQAQLDFNVRRASKSLIGSAASGEGVVNEIKGSGRVYLAPVPNLYQNLVATIAPGISATGG